jgi:hypothetical protein
MNGVTFEFKSEKNWIRVWEALNDTAYHFASYGYKAITVFSEKGIEELREVLKKNRIAYKEI